NYTVRPLSRPITVPPSGTAPVDPQVGFTVELWMATLGNALMPATFDRSYNDSARLWLSGNGPGIAPNLPPGTVQDPYSGKTYVAISYKQGVIETGVAARMIARAQELSNLLDPSDPSTETALKSYLQMLDAQLNVSDIYADLVY